MQASDRHAKERQRQVRAYRREVRAKEGVGRKGVQLRASRGTRNRLRAITHMHNGLAAMQGDREVKYVGWRRSAAEALGRIVETEYARLVETLTWAAGRDGRAANLLDRATQIANGYF